MNPTPSAISNKNKYIPSNLHFGQPMYKNYLCTIIFTLCQMTSNFIGSFAAIHPTLYIHPVLRYLLLTGYITVSINPILQYLLLTGERMYSYKFLISQIIEKYKSGIGNRTGLVRPNKNETIRIRVRSQQYNKKQTIDVNIS